MKTGFYTDLIDGSKRPFYAKRNINKKNFSPMVYNNPSMWRIFKKDCVQVYVYLFADKYGWINILKSQIIHEESI